MKEFEHDDPMILMAHEITGDAGVIARCEIEEFAQLGYGAEEILGLFLDPNHTMMHMILSAIGEEKVRDLIQNVLSELGPLRVTMVEHPGCEHDD